MSTSVFFLNMDILIHFLYCNILLVLTNMVSCIYHNIIQKSFTALKHPLCLEKEMAIHSSSLAWEIPGTEEPGGPQSMGSQRVRHGLVTEQSFFFLISNEVLKFYYFNWRIIYLHYCGGFCYTSTWITHGAHVSPILNTLLPTSPPPGYWKPSW